MPRSYCKRCQRGEECPIPHGRPSGYDYHRCKCDDCISYRRHRDDNKREKVAEQRRESYRLRDKTALKKAVSNYYRDNKTYRDTQNAATSSRLKATTNHFTRRGGWTQTEDNIIMRHDISTTEMCYILMRPYRSVIGRRYLIRKNLKHKGNIPNTKVYWTPEEDAIVMRDDITVRKMMDLLGRSRPAIHGRRAQLSDRPRKSQRMWTPAEDIFVMRNDLSRPEKAKALGRTVSAVKNRIRMLRRNRIFTTAPVVYSGHDRRKTDHGLG